MLCALGDQCVESLNVLINQKSKETSRTHITLFYILLNEEVSGPGIQVPDRRHREKHLPAPLDTHAEQKRDDDENHACSGCNC